MKLCDVLFFVFDPAGHNNAHGDSASLRCMLGTSSNSQHIRPVSSIKRVSRIGNLCLNGVSHSRLHQFHRQSHCVWIHVEKLS